MQQSQNVIKKKLDNAHGLYGLSPIVYPVQVQTAQGDAFTALFTAHELQRAVKRGEKYMANALESVGR